MPVEGGILTPPLPPSPPPYTPPGGIVVEHVAAMAPQNEGHCLRHLGDGAPQL